MLIDHVDIRVRDLSASRRFYSAALGALDIRVVADRPDEIGFGEDGSDDFSIHLDGAASSGVHIAFLASSRNEVEKFYRAATEAGAPSDAPPGVHEEYGPSYYAAFVLDPDGNVVEAVYVGP